MRTYWDTSAAVNAAISPEVFRRLDAGEHVARLHLLAEFFATMTGRGVEITDDDGNVERLAFTQKECAAWLKNFAQRVKFEELSSPNRGCPRSANLRLLARVGRRKDEGR
jgi:hypothetical protein